MKNTLTEKLLSSHLLSGRLAVGEEIGLLMDQTLTQDATGTMAYLALDAMGVSRVKTELSVAYVDHNTLGSGFENADDHRFLCSAAKKFGLYYSRPGNGICHQVHLERFGIPGKTLIGSDSHTPTAGALGMLAIGAGGLDVAAAMGGSPYYIKCPAVFGVELVGSLPPHVTAKDVILKLLGTISVKGGVGYILEYYGEGVKSLSLTERATITNMGAECGATSSVFPSDEITLDYMRRHGREEDWTPVFANEGAEYERNITIDLSALVPMAACPHMADLCVPVSELSEIKVDQVCIGSCTNSSFADLSAAAEILRGKTIAENVSLTVSPGSREVLTALSKSGALDVFLSAGARLLECVCGPCIGMGQSPCSGGVSLRTFNRNFKGRSGTADAKIYLVSPETAAISAVTGYITDPRVSSVPTSVTEPEKFEVNTNMIIPPADERCELIYGPNIKPFPAPKEFPDVIEADVSIKVGDNITTDDIMPAGAKVLPFRSNIPAISKFCFSGIDSDFSERAKSLGESVIVGGENYGQGSSREHAALAPFYLGIRAVVVKSFARIHRSNLINMGIIPCTFENPDDYDRISEGDTLKINAQSAVMYGSGTLANLKSGETFRILCPLGERERTLLLSGGLLGYIKLKAGGNE
ncbi:MAG: aconitate hydratase [Firmicutes bacterium]|nr:aconitate hydratase [Bacillota bacterium]